MWGIRFFQKIWGSFGNVVLITLFKCCGNMCRQKSVVEIRVVLCCLNNENYCLNNTNKQTRFPLFGWKSKQERSPLEIRESLVWLKQGRRKGGDAMVQSFNFCGGHHFGISLNYGEMGWREKAWFFFFFLRNKKAWLRYGKLQLIHM